LAGKFCWENFGGKILAGKFRRENLGGKFVDVNVNLKMFFCLARFVPKTRTIPQNNAFVYFEATFRFVAAMAFKHFSSTEKQAKNRSFPELSSQNFKKYKYNFRGFNLGRSSLQNITNLT
jgi:hypothetical protein